MIIWRKAQESKFEGGRGRWGGLGSEKKAIQSNWSWRAVVKLYFEGAQNMLVQNKPFGTQVYFEVKATQNQQMQEKFPAFPLPAENKYTS